MATQPFHAVIDIQLPAGQLRLAIEAAVDAAAGVHEVDAAAQPLVVVSQPLMTGLGLYAHERGGRPIAILVNEQASDPRLTLLHEVGHYLDQHAIGAPTFASVTSGLDEWRDAAPNSQAVADCLS